MVRSRSFVVWLLCVLAAMPGSASAPDGGKVVRVPDEVGSKCIDPYKDKIWLTLRGLVSSRTSGWFTKDTSVGVLIKTTVRAEGKEPITFPLMTEAAFGDGPAGQVSLPIEYPLISGLVLEQDEAVVTGANVQITLLNIRDRTKLGSALAVLAEITSSEKLPIPSSPYTKGASYLLDFANKAVEKDLNSQKVDDKAVVAALTFNLDPNGECGGDFEQTGTKAVLFGEGTQGPGYVPIDRINDFCWSATMVPTFVLKAAAKEGGLDCDDGTYSGKFRDVTNNYIGLFLNKRAVVKTLGEDSIAVRDKDDSWKRCIANGITDAEDCPGAGI